MHETTLNSRPNPLKSDPDRDAAETLDICGVEEETVAAAANTGELAPFSASDVGVDLGVRSASLVVIRKPLSS